MTRPSAFEAFVSGFTRLMDEAAGDEPRILDAGGRLLAELVARDDWLPKAFAQPHPQHYGQYLLHCDPQERFSVVSFVWGPGQRTPVHDHTVWGLIGMLRGAERAERFTLAGPGSAMAPQGTERLEPGQVDRVSPAIGDIHRVSNAFDDRVSISIHAYGGNIGRIRRHVFDEHTGAMKEFVSGYMNPPAVAAAAAGAH
jgi:predicted metal-dependent enzyme (double-stranded beta helix superfamily)